MHYYVVGVNGSGKTSLLKAISDKTDIDIIHGTSELMNYLEIPGDYSALRAMNQDDVLERWGETATNLATDYGDKPFLLDTHIMNLTNGNIVRRDGDWIARYDVLVLVHAEPSITLSRIEQDIGKDRALFPSNINNRQKLELLQKYQQETEKLFNVLTDKYNLPSLVIDNSGSIAQSVNAFIHSQVYR
ncbi:MAG TPA: ATP-binding protein [Candidatus Saccharimonadales bacterium]|jgi:adenylate kinase